MMVHSFTPQLNGIAFDKTGLVKGVFWQLECHRNAVSIEKAIR